MLCSRTLFSGRSNSNILLVKCPVLASDFNHSQKQIESFEKKKRKRKKTRGTDNKLFRAIKYNSTDDKNTKITEK